MVYNLLIKLIIKLNIFLNFDNFCARLLIVVFNHEMDIYHKLLIILLLIQLKQKLVT